MNMTFSSLALCSPSSVVICLLDRSREGGKERNIDRQKNCIKKKRKRQRLTEVHISIGEKEELRVLIGPHHRLKSWEMAEIVILMRDHCTADQRKAIHREHICYLRTTYNKKINEHPIKGSDDNVVGRVYFQLKERVHPAINILSPSCCFKPVWLTFFCETWKSNIEE